MPDSNLKLEKRITRLESMVAVILGVDDLSGLTFSETGIIFEKTDEPITPDDLIDRLAG